MDPAIAPPPSLKAYSELLLGDFEESKVAAMARRARAEVGGKADLAFLFVSREWQDNLADLVELIQIHGHCPRVVGCSAGGIIGIGREEEDALGCSLLFLSLPDVEIFTGDMPAGDGTLWQSVRQWNTEGCAGWILLGNPLHLGEEWLERWNSTVNNAQTYGGLASGGLRATDLFVFDQHGRKNSAAIAIGFRGDIKLSGLVSQGCRPIGEPLTITKADHNLILQLASQNAYHQLQAAFQSIPEPQRDGAQGNILVGLAMSEYVDEYQTGDFLVRSILGGDPNKGALAVGALPRVGQTLQFQLRDRQAAEEDLRTILEQKKGQIIGGPAASLLFSCGGRGEQLFGRAHHDAGMFEGAFGSLPMAGFFCNGEIGTVGDRAYLHGFTASGVFFSSATP